MTVEDRFTRRTFVKGAAVVTAWMLTNSAFAKKSAVDQDSGGDSASVPHRSLGKTGEKVSALGVGGYHLGSTKNQQETTELVATAMGAGTNFFDNCWEYDHGVSEEKLGIALKGFKPLTAEATQATRDRVRQFAADGRFELFKTTTKYDGKEGREQHHFPTVEKLAV